MKKLGFQGWRHIRNTLCFFGIFVYSLFLIVSYFPEICFEIFENSTFDIDIFCNSLRQHNNIAQTNETIFWKKEIMYLQIENQSQLMVIKGP